MQTVKCEIKGLRPYFFSKPTEDKTPRTDAAAIKVAKNRVYFNGNLFAPSRQIKWSMITAVEMAKMQIQRSTKRAKDLMKTTLLTVSPNELYFKPKMTMNNVQVGKIWTNLDMGKGKFVHCAYIDLPWGLEFDLLVGEMFEPDWIKEALENAGILACIGGKRPDNGAFEVVRYEVLA